MENNNGIMTTIGGALLSPELVAEFKANGKLRKAIRKLRKAMRKVEKLTRPEYDKKVSNEEL